MTSKLSPLLLMLAVLLAGCVSSSRLNFEKMSEQEIYAYNLDQPLLKKIYCYEDSGTGSYIRRRNCVTVEDYMYQLERSVLALDVLQPSASFNAFSSSRD
ncbi:MAG: hypothetical protein R3F41_06320 [Gammaproteobacteria bacterium]|nr:hypothetical protein [Pseudomonadales bacterium]MCP5348530.1 hypothetical protein [Pseudomonadales bacterium]